jgi:hypothetical protein
MVLNRNAKDLLTVKTRCHCQLHYQICNVYVNSQIRYNLCVQQKSSFQVDSLWPQWREKALCALVLSQLIIKFRI